MEISEQESISRLLDSSNLDNILLALSLLDNMDFPEEWITFGNCDLGYYIYLIVRGYDYQVTFFKEQFIKPSNDLEIINEFNRENNNILTRLHSKFINSGIDI